MNLDLPNISYCLAQGWVKLAPAVVEVAPKRRGSYGRSRRPIGCGKNLDKINAWLATAKSGDECSRDTFDINPSSSRAAFRGFLEAGQLRVAHAARNGKQGSPIIYAKV